MFLKAKLVDAFEYTPDKDPRLSEQEKEHIRYPAGHKAFKVDVDTLGEYVGWKTMLEDGLQKDGSVLFYIEPENGKDKGIFDVLLDEEKTDFTDEFFVARMSPEDVEKANKIFAKMDSDDPAGPDMKKKPGFGF